MEGSGPYINSYAGARSVQMGDDVDSNNAKIKFSTEMAGLLSWLSSIDSRERSMDQVLAKSLLFGGKKIVSLFPR